MEPKISVVIPVYNEKFIERTLNTLRTQECKDFEVIVVDDCSTDGTYELLQEYSKRYPFVIIRNARNRGPAASRNIGVKSARPDIVAFTDSDCMVEGNWVGNIIREIESEDAIMGKVVVPNSSFMGDCISALGFPAGGHVGFESMWRVSDDGYTTQLVTANCAIRRGVFDAIGFFDETFPQSFGEDTELSHRLLEGFKIKYCPKVRVYHRPRETFLSFVGWALNRGRGKYHLERRVDMHSLIDLRVWSSKNIIKKYKGSIKLPVIVTLMALLFLLQELGWFLEKHFRRAGSR